MTPIFRALDINDYKWLKKFLNPVLCDDTTGIVAQDIMTHEILGVAVYDNWTPTSCQAHVAVFKPFIIRHGFLKEVFEYPFIHCGRRMILGMTPANNLKALKFNKKMGFEEIFRLPDAFDEGIDYVCFKMDKDNCRWITPIKEAA